MITAQELSDVLDLHRKWRDGEEGGVRADLRDESTALPAFFVCPEFGSFTAWKKLSGNIIAELLIPAEAKRTSSLVGRKCRAEFAKVVSLHGTEKTEAYDKHTGKLLYKIGEIVYPDSYNDDFTIECCSGIHYFITKREAELY